LSKLFLGRRLLYFIKTGIITLLINAIILQVLACYWTEEMNEKKSTNDKIVRFGISSLSILHYAL
jgi:hypothetical protein